MPTDNKNILREAEALVYGDREKDYGSPLNEFLRTAKIWSAIIGAEVTPQQVALCMVGLKISRECHKHKRDNLIDGAGYFATLEKVYNEINASLSDGSLESLQDLGIF